MQPKSDAASGRGKSPTALKTIKEAADILDVPQHVLRFWETKFPQINPLKRGGGRRYYRPDDIDTLIRIKNLLYKQGYTIQGARKAFDKLEEVIETFSDVARGEPVHQDNDNDGIDINEIISIPETVDVSASTISAPEPQQRFNARELAQELRALSAELRRLL